MFCESVQHRLRFCPCHLNCIKMAAFQFCLQLGNREKKVWWGTTVMLFLVKYSLVKKGSVRGCVVLMQQQVLVSPKFGANFHAITVKYHSSMRNWLLGLLGWIHCDVKENDEHALGFALYHSCLLWFWWVWTFCVQLMLSFPKTCLIIARVSVTLFPRFAQNLMLFLCWVHCEIASGQMHDSK
jgi:hypothetical protein